MQGDRNVLGFYDERVLAHRPEAQEPFLPGRMDNRVRGILQGLGLQAKWSYPEHPGRVTAVNDLLQTEPVPGVTLLAGPQATEHQLARVHTLSYLESIYELRGKQAWLDVDTTAVSAGRVEAAEVAPGSAVAAAHTQSRWDVERVLIIDWDAHHGNGTQDIFAADPSVIFFDTHRAEPFYPGTGNLEEVGEGLGEGTIVNVPLPEETGDRALLTAYEYSLGPPVESIKPELILVSAGMDAHRTELCLNLSYDGFSAMVGVVQRLADTYRDGHLAMVTEGGNDQSTLAAATMRVLEVMAGGQPAVVRDPGMAEVAEITSFHQSTFAATV